MFEKDADTNIIMDFDEGVDSIEFLIEAFGYDELDVLQDADEVTLTESNGGLRLVDVNAGGLSANNFLFGSTLKMTSTTPDD